jgi:hypothetical protein
MSDCQVTCINKPHHLSSHEHITHIGNTAGNWRLTLASAISRLDKGSDTFFTIDASTGNRVEIGVYREVGKQPFLRTHADGKWKDNLLAQQECGSNCKIIG